MSQLSAFPPEDIDLIVSLPYRVGINISYAEDEEGELDDEREMQSLESCFKNISKLDDESEFIAEVASEVLKRKSDWSNWEENTFDLTPDCKKVIKILKPVLSEKELKSYKKMLLNVAVTVAQAYGEFGDAQEEKGFFGKVMEKVIRNFSGGDSGQPMNVSAAEDSAISKIREALNSAG